MIDLRRRITEKTKNDVWRKQERNKLWYIKNAWAKISVSAIKEVKSNHE